VVANWLLAQSGGFAFATEATVEEKRKKRAA
jgi:hypothetical protein